MSITYRTGDVFQALAHPGAVLAHACNAQGVWGSGVAAQFKQRFPEQFERYRVTCASSLARPRSLVGQVRLFDPVACLITSDGYGAHADSVVSILGATASAARALLGGLMLSCRAMDIHSPRINAGLFRVPWEHTAAVLERGLANFPGATWTVWTP